MHDAIRTRKIKQSANLFAFEQLDFTDIEDSLRSLTACSPGIPFKVLKHCHSVITPLLTHLMNNVLLAGRMPDDWKVAIVTLLLKKGDPTIMAN